MEGPSLEDVRSRISQKLQSRAKGLPPRGAKATASRSNVRPQRGAQFQDSPRQNKLMSSPPPGPLYGQEEGRLGSSGRRYLIPTTSSSQSFDVRQDASPSPQLLRENQELRTTLQVYKDKLHQAEFQLKKQRKWLLELNQIKDNIKFFRSSKQPADSRDTSMELRSPEVIRKTKLMSFSEYEEGRQDDEEVDEEIKGLEQDLAIVRKEGGIIQNKAEVDRLRGELKAEKEKGIRLADELQDSVEAKDRYLRELMELRKSSQKAQEHQDRLIEEKLHLEQQLNKLQSSLQTTQKELREQRTERSYSQADCQRRISEIEQGYERKIQDMRRHFDEEIIQTKLRAGSGLSKYIMKPEREKQIQTVGQQEYLKLKEYSSQLQKVNTLLNNENRTLIAMLTRLCSPAQLQNLSQAINLVINSNPQQTQTPSNTSGNLASRSLRSSGVSRIPSSSNLYQTGSMPSILYESYQFTQVAPNRMTSRNQTFRRSATASRLRQAGGIYSSLVRGNQARMRSPGPSDQSSSERKVPSRSGSAYRSSKFIQKQKLNSSFTSGLHHTFAENKAIPEEESHDLSSLYPSPPYESGYFADIGSAADVQFAIQELLTSLREDCNSNLKIQKFDDFTYLIGEERKKVQLKISGNTLYMRLGGGYIDFLQYLSKGNFLQ